MTLTTPLLLLLTLTGNLSERQRSNYSEKYAMGDSGKIVRQNVRVAFYNLENLYDAYDDSLKMDEEFTKEGAKHWSYSRFRTKLNHVAKTFLAMGTDEPPAIIGVCEVENRYVLNKLVYDSPLKRFGYRFVHHDSPDLRGVDVALLYMQSRFTPIQVQTFPIRFPFDTLAQTREILLVQGRVIAKDTIHILVNHWPSRRGGYQQSQPRRNYVAGVVRRICDSLLTINLNSNILIMGDLNDEPDKESLVNRLKVVNDTSGFRHFDLLNLMAPMMRRWNEGTLKYQGQWSIFDQFIVSGNLLLGKAGLRTTFRDVHIFQSPFLTSDDSKNFGVKLNRTYQGPRYNGGFSDHLPIYMDIKGWTDENE
jgi:hypothetical protein